MKIFLSGGTGFIGSHLTKKLLEEKHSLTVLSRSNRRSHQPGMTFLQGDPTRSGPWQEAVARHDAVINLAGASIFRRWSEGNKKRIRESRLLTTANICEAAAGERSLVKVLINASAVGYYGARGDETLDEESGPGEGFLAEVCRGWERETQRCSARGVRVVRCRFGIVLGPDGGALSMMTPIFTLGLGSPLGTGNQWFSWIHLDDLIHVFRFILANETIDGPVNCTSPNPVTNREFTKALARALHRPAFLPAAPSFLLKMVLGEFSSVLLTGQKVMPRVLQQQGYIFGYPEVDTALRQIMSRR